MTDMSDTILAKSDQLNAVDLCDPITIKIESVTIAKGDQPVSIHYQYENGRPWKPCKNMRRVLVSAWGSAKEAYIGRRITLFNDESVKWAGVEVGGVRISHLSDIKGDLKIPLQVSRGKKIPFSVSKLADEIVLPTATAEELEEYEEKFLAVVGEDDLKTLAEELVERNFEKSSKAIIMEFYKDAKKRITDEKPQHFVEGE